jgi:hypothetical protein
VRNINTKEKDMKVIAATIAAAATLGAQATILPFHSLRGLSDLGSFTGTMDWRPPAVASVDGCGELVISLTNTSPEANGGYLTGLAVNFIAGLTVTFNADPVQLPGWVGFNSQTCSPWGVFDAGAALGGDWSGGGDPNQGIPVGQTRSFSFSVCGDPTLLASLGVEELFREGDHYAFAARFKGFVNGGSDKVPAQLPAPGAAAVLLGAFAGRRRR